MNIDYVLLFVAGMLIGGIIAVIFRRKPFGTLRIDRSNPEKDVYKLELGDLDVLAKKKRIVLSVDSHANLSHN